MGSDRFINESKHEEIHVGKSHTTVTFDLDELSSDSKLILKSADKKAGHTNNETAHPSKVEKSTGDRASHYQFHQGRGQTSDEKRLGFPSLKIVGFDQEATQTSEGLMGDVVREIKDSVFGAETISDKIKSKVFEDLTPSEQQKYRNENARIQQSSGAEKFVERMMSPMHNKVDQQSRDIEEKITEKIRSTMSAGEKGRLDEQLQKFEEKKIESKIRKDAVNSGLGKMAMVFPVVKLTSTIMKLEAEPVPGNAVKNYFDRIKEESTKYLND